MKCIKIIIVFFVICLAFGAAQLYAGSDPPAGSELGKKTLSGTLTVILLEDPLDPDYDGYVAVITGTCKKVPFLVGPIYRDNGFSDLDEANFLDENGDPNFYYYGTGVLSECDPDTYGGGITGFKSWNKFGDVIFAEIYFNLLYPISP